MTATITQSEILNIITMVYRMIVTCVLLLQFCHVESVFTSCLSQNVPYVEVCESKSLTARTVYLSSTRTPGDDLRCNCTLKFTGQSQQTVYIGLSPINETTYGCQHELAIRHKNNTGEFSCATYNGYSYGVDLEDMIDIELIPGIYPNSDSGFLTCLEITTTPGSQVTLACNEETFPTESTVSAIPTTARPPSQGGEVTTTAKPPRSIKMFSTDRVFTTTVNNPSTNTTTMATEPISPTLTISYIDLIPWILLGVSLLVNINFIVCCIGMKCCKRQVGKKENPGNYGDQFTTVTDSNRHPVRHGNTMNN